MEIDWVEIRAWIQLAFVVTGGVLALVAFFQNLRQRRVENALKFIALYRDAIGKDDVEEWKSLFRSSSELTGAPLGQYISHVANSFRPISDYFSEGAESDAILRMAQSLDVVCHQVLTGAADARTVYFELGQFLNTMNRWLCSVPGNAEGRSLSDEFPNINAFMRRYQSKSKSWPCRAYAYVE